MKQGDFTLLAKQYINRVGYSERVLKTLAHAFGAFQEGFVIADVGAGTGKLTENLIELGLSGFAVEPNDAMREEGVKYLQASDSFTWSKGSAEATGLADQSVDWLFMASSFHWADTALALKEFRRVLKPGGHFTALWNPRNLEKNALHQRIETKIYEIVPHIQRVSSGSAKHMQNIEEQLLSTTYFNNLLFVEAPHEVQMSKERYMGAWRSVNDIRAQAGEEKFAQILEAIEHCISEEESIMVPYKTRSWTVQLCE